MAPIIRAERFRRPVPYRFAYRGETDQHRATDTRSNDTDPPADIRSQRISRAGLYSLTAGQNVDSERVTPVVDVDAHSGPYGAHYRDLSVTSLYAAAPVQYGRH